MAALAGESQNIDGNGQYVRFQPGGGSQTFATGPSNNGGAQQFFRPSATPVGVRPVYPGKRPPYRPDVECHTQGVPDINSAQIGPPDGGQGPAAGGPAQPGTPPASGPVGPTPALPTLPGLPTIPGAGR
jgi:hypothetical protein